MPLPTFISKLFASCTKVRPLVHLTKAYMHWCYHDSNHADKLFETVMLGLKDRDFDKIRPFLVLFQHMIENADQSEAFGEQVNMWLNQFFD